MRYGALSVVAPPARLPVDIDLVRSHLRLDTIDDDALLGTYAAAATDWAETYLNRALITRTYRYVLSRAHPSQQWPWIPLTAPLFVFPQWFPATLLETGLIELPNAPLQAVSSVSIGTWGQADVALVAGQDFDVDAVMQPGRVRVRPQFRSFPQDHQAIVYTAGYGDQPDAIPSTIILGVLWLCAWFYENRGDVMTEPPAAVTRILSPYRLVPLG